jgi:hypothetical protein
VHWLPQDGAGFGGWQVPGTQWGYGANPLPMHCEHSEPAQSASPRHVSLQLLRGLRVVGGGCGAPDGWQVAGFQWGYGSYPPPMHELHVPPHSPSPRHCAPQERLGLAVGSAPVGEQKPAKHVVQLVFLPPAPAEAAAASSATAHTTVAARMVVVRARQKGLCPTPHNAAESTARGCADRRAGR